MHFKLPLAVVLATCALALACSDEEDSRLPRITVLDTGATASATPAASASPSPSGSPTPTPTPRPALKWQVRIDKPGGKGLVVVGDGRAEITVTELDPAAADAERWAVAFVADVDGIADPDGVLSRYTGGGACCTEYLVVRSVIDGVELLDWFSLGNGGLSEARDVSGDGRVEFVGTDDRLTYLPEISYAASPTLPLLLCPGPDLRFFDCTAQYPDLLTAAADQFAASLLQAVGDDPPSETTLGIAAGLYGAYVRLGRPGEGTARIATTCPACVVWLAGHADQIDAALAEQRPVR